MLGLYDCLYTLQALVKAVKLMCPDDATRADVRGVLTKVVIVSKEKVTLPEFLPVASFHRLTL